MAVDVRCGARLAVPEPSADGADVLAGGDQQRGVGMAQRVDVYALQFSFSDERTEPPGERVRVHGRAVPGREHPIAILPEIAHLQPLRVLPHPILFQCGHGDAGQLNRPYAGLVLRAFLENTHGGQILRRPADAER